jgi:SOS-response transcriptional repressor LexA
MDGCIDIDPTTLRLPKNARTFALKVRGDSMRNAAILECDVVIMEFREAKHDDIVAALIDGELTLKRFNVQGGVSFPGAAAASLAGVEVSRRAWQIRTRAGERSEP